ncbi:CDP-diacylglycerol diphosphatase [Roseomonas sp. AR75]|uniref:CDP-diacylglycerol diphosphatase n=1 Tax=Roseomonas sp. AR75 TaxID=2562311 RepID=UPI001980CD97|nr:CDP-diacylglycerol diphosphatase [Roseomonas sp. AR75]
MRGWSLWAVRMLGVASMLVLAAAGARANPDALWDIVHGRCVPDMQESASPAPCTLVSLGAGVERGYAALKDRRGIAQYLLIPTARVTGIEDPALLAAGTPNYFDAAWRIRDLVQARLPRALPRDGFSLAINSAYGRTQNQLHIHVDCVRADVRDALRDNAQQIGAAFAPFAPRLAGRRYLARRIAAAELTTDNPFLLLAAGVNGAREAMGRYTLVVVGMDFAGEGPGFVLLAGRADPTAGNPGSGEELQDHDCAIAR